MKPPIKPKQEDCCDSGCNPCIFDIYYKQLSLYKKYLESGDTSISFQNAITQLEYTEFILQKTMDICQGHRVLFFKQKSKDNKVKVQWNPGEYFLIKYVSVNNTSCTRAYTPLQPNRYYEDLECALYDFFIVVKKYDSGIVSNYLHNLRAGQSTFWRGPYGSYEMKPNKFHKLFMICQGTGILPFLSIIDHILKNEDDNTRMLLFYCCENINTILFRDKLIEFKSYWNFTYKIFLSNSLANQSFKYLEPIISHKFSVEEILYLLPFKENDQFLISGSIQFMDNYQSELQKCGASLFNIKLF